jgi:hypothetical protein
MRPAIWISYCPLAAARRAVAALCDMRQHQVLVEPRFAWEALYIGAGSPPVRTPLGWLLMYHGVRTHPLPPGDPRKPLRCSAGALLLDLQDPRIVRYRSPNRSWRLSSPRSWVGRCFRLVWTTVGMGASTCTTLWATRSPARRGSACQHDFPA